MAERRGISENRYKTLYMTINNKYYLENWVHSGYICENEQKIP